MLAVILILDGMCASLFGTGADIILSTLLVTRFTMNEKIATHMSIMLMASIPIFPVPQSGTTSCRPLTTTFRWH